MTKPVNIRNQTPFQKKKAGLIKVGTYNIHAGVGTDGLRDIARVAAMINTLECQVIALQEVLSKKKDPIDTLYFLEKETGMQAVAGITVHTGSQRFGNALLTRLPIMAKEKYDLSVDGREERGAIDLRITYLESSIRVLATHLGLKPQERRLQVQRLLDILSRSPESDEITIMMGDINEWFLWGRPLRWIHQYFGFTKSLRTFPAQRPLLALDRIWCHPPERLLSIKVHRSNLARIASDHLPLTALIRV